MKFKVGDKVVVSPKANPLLGGLSGIVVETQESPIADTAYYKVDLDEERVFPEHHLIAETEYRFLTGLNATAHQLLATCGIKTADSDTKVLRANDGISAKNGGKNSMKFTFYVTEGTRVDKSCNGTIPTMTTNIELLSGNAFDGVTTVKGSATCDKADYDERRGVLEALANAVCGGEFEKRYSKAVKANKDADLIMRTCTYCGKVCGTIEEKIEHEKWHVERKKARRERYLLRKRAKEIAFEEQAQKMAKEMIKEDK